MTDTPTIVQRARDLAATWAPVGYLWLFEVTPTDVREGRADHLEIVQAFITAITEAEAIGEARATDDAVRLREGLSLARLRFVTWSASALAEGRQELSAKVDTFIADIDALLGEGGAG